MSMGRLMHELMVHSIKLLNNNQFDDPIATE
jgi:hypothetical protein